MFDFEEQDRKYKIETNERGRKVIIFEEDGIAFDLETYENLFDGVCDTYPELTRMLKQMTKDVIEDIPNDKTKDDKATTEHAIIHHIDGLKEIIMACENCIEKFQKVGRQLGLSEQQINPQHEKKFEIYNYGEVFTGFNFSGDIETNRKRF